MIAGINTNSFIDYPGEISFVIFTGGCNFNCPYCHNRQIVLEQEQKYQIDTILQMLIERQLFITGVTITGGEPTIHGEALINLIKQVKALKFKIKLDTNGSNPSLLKRILNESLVDYVAMDLKNTFSKYALTVGKQIDLDAIKKSIKLLEASKIDYEIRTTVNKKMHTQQDIKEICTYLKDLSKYKLQSYRYSKEQLVDCDYGAWQEKELAAIITEIKTPV